MDTTGFATAYALTTSVGFRPFLTLALASLALHFGYLHPAHAFAYLGTDRATWLLAGLAAIEFAADKVPLVDHALHAVHFATKPIAAALLVGSAVPATGSPEAATYALMGLGAFNALGVHAGLTALRGVSTATTLGMANPLVSLLEDGLAIGSTVLAFALPFAGAAAALLLTLAILVLARRALVFARSRRPA